MFGQGPAVGVAARAALRPRVVRTFERRPEYDLRFRVATAFPFDVCLHRAEFEGSNVLGEVEGVRVVCRVRCDGVRVMVDTRNHLCALLTPEAGAFYAGRGSAGAAE